MDRIEQMSDRLQAYQAKTMNETMPEAGILVPLTRNPDNPEIILTRRSKKLSTHKGQVAFPGGKFDLDDGSLLRTALRECHEEIGVDPDTVDVVAPLSQLVSLHGILVTPFVGIVDEDVELKPNLDELDSIFKVPVDYIIDAEPKRRDKMTYKGMQLSVPSYDYEYEGEVYEIWGLSAIVMVELLNVAFDANITIFENYKKERL